jgi:hypothetical protein
MAGDIYFNDVSLLLHCDGTNGSTTFTDSSNNNLTVTANGNAQISTAQHKFGGASAYFDGTGDYLSIPNNDAFELGSSDFTIEFFIKPDTINTPKLLLDKRTASTNGFYFSQPTADPSKIAFGGGDGTTSITPIISSISISTSQFHHVALSKTGTTATMYIDGVSAGTTTITSFASNTAGLVIGVFFDLSGYFYAGFLDEIRITKGVARYTTNFTPPTSAFPDYQPYISGTLSESLAATDFKARVYQLSDGALVSDTTVTSSPYTLELQTLEPVLVTMLPDYGTQWAASTAYALNDKVFPTDPATSPYYYECTTAGTSDASEPTWPTSGTVNDGTAVWTYVEQMVQPITHGPLIPS